MQARHVKTVGASSARGLVPGWLQRYNLNDGIVGRNGLFAIHPWKLYLCAATTQGQKLQSLVGGLWGLFATGFATTGPRHNLDATVADDLWELGPCLRVPGLADQALHTC